MKACIGVTCEVRRTCVKWLHLDFLEANGSRMYWCPKRADGTRTMYVPVAGSEAHQHALPPVIERRKEI
jgi:hypothetical protein